MSHAWQLVTFDVYSALFDVEGSLVPLINRTFEAPIEALPLVRTWHSKQLEYALISNSLQRGRVSFMVATRRALDYVLGRAGLDVAEAMRDEWVQAWNRLRPWPEADQVLAAVKARGYRMGALSNGDEAMLREVLVGLATPFDDIFPSDQTGYYKPHPAVYALPLQARGIAPHGLLHVAGSATDVLGARSAGLTCAWSNRQRDRVFDPAYQANYEFADLTGVLELLER